MGLLIEGQWHDQWYETKTNNGQFIRPDAQFRNWITPDGSAGLSGEAGFKAESGRYHLYVSLACPWANRTLIFRKLKQLEQHISVSIVSPDMLSSGWTFNANPDVDDDIEVIDHLFNSTNFYEIYQRANPNYTGRVTVPVIWDKKLNTIVSNESSEIIRMFNSAFNELTNNQDNYYPETLKDTIDKVNIRVYDTINNGVYRTGFATTQEAYHQAVTTLFENLDWLEKLLDQQPFLAGYRMTEADWRLFTTLVRFDAVYVGHFKCNVRRIVDYPNLQNYLKALYQYPGIKETVNMVHCKRHYYYSHDTINPTRIVPDGPMLDLESPHNRDRF